MEEGTERISAFELARLTIAQTQFRVSTELAHALDRALEVSASTLDVRHVGIWVNAVTRGVRELRCLRAYDRATGEVTSGAVLALEAIPAYETAISGRRVVAAHDALNDPRTACLRDAYLLPRNIGAMLDAPIFRAGHVQGVVCHEHVGTSRTWTPREIDFAVSVADMVATLIEQASRIELEEQASQGRRLEALGQLAAGVAHDFNNILHSISLESERALRMGALSDPASQSFRQVIAQTERGARLVQQLMFFAKPTVNTNLSCDAEATLLEMVPVFRSLLQDPWHLQLATTGTALPIALDRAAYEQVLLNLIVNARDAMPAGGEVVVKLETTGGGCELTVQDQGPGIPETLRDRVFEPFFTTKPPESGTGLGLSIVNRIVQNAHGTLRLESAPGQGARFAIWIPAAGNSASA